MKKIFLNLIFLCSIVSLSSCTISFQNISTHGTATDLVDQDQKATSDLKSDMTIPLKII